MQILIEIPDDEYKMLVNPYQWNESQCMRLKRIVISGTVIPKNHGRLVDADQIINVVKEIYDSSPVKTLVTSADMYFLKKVLDNSNVIIEAEKEKGEEWRMTDYQKFQNVIKRNNKRFWEVSAGLGMSPQSLYNKIGNATEFTQSELAKFREMFPDVTDDEFNEIFFAVNVTADANA